MTTVSVTENVAGTVQIDVVAGAVTTIEVASAPTVSVEIPALQGPAGPPGPQGIPGEASNTDLAATADATNVVVTSSTGNDATLPSATNTAAGVATAAQITKLDGISAGAEVNVNADWNAVVGDAQILNKPTIPTALSQMADDTTHRVVTDVEKADWNSKEPGFGKNTAFNKNFGVVGGSVCEGNDTRLTNSRNPTAHKNTHKVGGSDSLFPIDYIQFDTTASVPSEIVGQAYWNNVDKCISVQTGNGTTLDLGLENRLPLVRNLSGSPITDGTPVFISGVAAGYPTIQPAKASEMTAVKTLAVVTENIANGALGFATTFGVVHNIYTNNLIAGEPFYLGTNGGFTATKPAYPDSVVAIGTCLAVDAVSGHIHVDITPDVFQKGFDVMRQPIGVFDKSQSTLTYNSATREMTISPTGAYWAWFNKGIENRTSVPVTLVHANTTGGHFFYIDENGVFTQSSTPWDLIRNIPLMYVYYNSATVQGLALEERHGATRNPEWHRNAHFNIGTYYVSGLSATGYALTGTTDAQNQFGISAGIIRDEDLESAISGQTDGATYKILWREGVTGDWRSSDSTVPYLSGATYAQYNQNTGSTWQMTEVANGDFLNIYVLIVPCIVGGFSVYCVPAQTVHASLALAQGAAFTQDISWGAVPLTEFVIAHKFTMRAGNSYTPTGRVRIEGYQDLRGTTTRIQVSNSAGATTHNGLSGLNDGDYRHLTATEYADIVLEAPVDGKQYARKDGAWVEVVGGSGGEMATFDAVLNFGSNKPIATATISDTSMTTTKIIQCFFTDKLDEVAVMNMRVNERARTAGVGFEIIGVAPDGAFGTYPVRCIVSGS